MTETAARNNGESSRAASCWRRQTSAARFLRFFCDDSACASLLLIVAAPSDLHFVRRILSVLFLSAPVSSLALSHDSNCLLLSCLDSTYRLLDVASGEVLNEYEGAVAQQFRMEGAFDNTDGFVAAGSEDGSVIVWDLVEVSCTDTQMHRCTRAQSYNEIGFFLFFLSFNRVPMRPRALNFFRSCSACCVPVPFSSLFVDVCRC